MPTMNPRVQVTLSPSLHALVARMASHQRLSKSQVLRELLEAAEPALQRAAALMDAASKAAEEAKSKLARSLSTAQDAAEVELGKVLSVMDGAADDLVAQAEAIRGRRPARKAQASSPAGGRVTPNRSPAARSPRPADPPLSNRGVKSPKRGRT